MMTQIDGQMSMFDLMATVIVNAAADPDAITQAEIDRCLQTVSNSVGKRRIVDFFAQERSNSARADFLKKEYGTGGCLPCYTLEDEEKEIGMYYDARGIRLRYYRGKKETRLTWTKAARIIDRLIVSGAYDAEEREDDDEED